MPTALSGSGKFDNILKLPKDKSVLEYIKQRLAEHSSHDRFEVINELFEMYRTSTGFDPLSLSKGRFNRIKATELKLILADINKEIPSITDSAEYKEYLHQQNRSAAIFEKLNLIKNKMEKNNFSDMAKEVRDLKEQILMSEDNELMVALANMFAPYLKEKDQSE